VWIEAELAGWLNLVLVTRIFGCGLLLVVISSALDRLIWDGMTLPGQDDQWPSASRVPGGGALGYGRAQAESFFNHRRVSTRSSAGVISSSSTLLARSTFARLSRIAIRDTSCGRGW
jgi:hypothetical protein